MIRLRLRAPFAAWRPLGAGPLRVSYPVMPPSAAAGLLLNLAGVDVRDPGSHASGQRGERRTPPRALRVAVGEVRRPAVSRTLHQAHHHPVGAVARDLRPGTHGAKFLIAPVTYEVLCGVDLVVCAEGPDDFERAVVAGLEQRDASYGVPFAGVAEHAWDDVDVDHSTTPAHWWEAVPFGSGIRPRVFDLPVLVDRDDAARSTTARMAPTAPAAAEPPTGAWVGVV